MLSDLALAGRDGAPTGRTMLAALGEGAGYLAPEQAASCHIGGQLGGPAVPAMPAAATADIYALGALLYALLVGRPPHLGATPLDTLLLAVGQPVTPPRRLLPGLDRRLEAICMRCLETAPEKRYPTAGELCNALRLYLC
jgi:serine/threonine protein kinase